MPEGNVRVEGAKRGYNPHRPKDTVLCSGLRRLAFSSHLFGLLPRGLVPIPRDSLAPVSLNTPVLHPTDTETSRNGCACAGSVAIRTADYVPLGRAWRALRDAPRGA